jgi:RNA polymerase sigma-70 factor (ECF subfamily)
VKEDSADAARRPEAFEHLYRREFDYVWQVLRSLGVRAQELPDVTQDTFVTVYARLHTYDPARPLRPWLFGVAFRVALKHWRRVRHRETPTHEVDALDQKPGADEQMIEHETADEVTARVEKALACLDYERRAVLVAHDFEGISGTDIAIELGLSQKNVYYRLKTAREQFVAALRRAKKVG